MSVLGYMQRIGRALMVPVAVLPAAAIMMTELAAIIVSIFPLVRKYGEAIENTTSSTAMIGIDVYRREKLSKLFSKLFVPE